MSGRLLNNPNLYVNFEVTDGKDKGFYRIEPSVLTELNQDPNLLEARVAEYNTLSDTNMNLVVRYAQLLGRQEDVLRKGTSLAGIFLTSSITDDRLIRITYKIASQLGAVHEQNFEVKNRIEELGVYGKYETPAKNR